MMCRTLRPSRRIGLLRPSIEQPDAPADIRLGVRAQRAEVLGDRRAAVHHHAVDDRGEDLDPGESIAPYAGGIGRQDDEVRGLAGLDASDGLLSTSRLWGSVNGSARVLDRSGGGGVLE